MLLVPACKKVLFTYFCLFISLFLILAFARGQREARGDHLRTLDFAEKRDLLTKRLGEKKKLFHSDYKETSSSLPTAYLIRLYGIFSALSFRNNLSHLVP